MAGDLRQLSLSPSAAIPNATSTTIAGGVEGLEWATVSDAMPDLGFLWCSSIPFCIISVSKQLITYIY